jgi:diketogulonate reductase-like aldo/keto reductase
MTTTTILNDGRYIPNLAFGTGSVLKRQDATAQVLAALNAGFTHIDTAQMYQNEQTVGKALSEFFKTRKDKTNVDVDVDVEKGFYSPKRREAIWVTTKLGSGTAGAVGELRKSLEKVHFRMPSTVADQEYLLIHVASTCICRSLPRT